ncbi:hypothetical protein J1N35_023689, partial [Gossypium stocksii]
VRNLMSRCIAIRPSLIVPFISGSQGAGRLIITASLPFALIPFRKFSSSSTKMGPYTNSKIKSEWQKFLSFVRPGFLVSLAYLDPDNRQSSTDLQAGANHRYELLCVVLIGLVFALIIQSLAANLGVSTGKHLSELCKAEYPKLVKYYLWLLPEIAVIVADILEARKVEMLIAMLVFVMAGCFFGEMSYVKSPASDVITGMFVLKLAGQGATADAIALLGALVMPVGALQKTLNVLTTKPLAYVVYIVIIRMPVDISS